MTNQEKIQEAAERIIEFGLDDTVWTTDELRRVAKLGTLFVAWEPAPKCTVWLRVSERKGDVSVLIEAKMGKVSHESAVKHGGMLVRVGTLAKDIERTVALMGAA